MAAVSHGYRAFVASANTDQSLPATFVAPSTVNMDDFPPPKRRLSKGARLLSQTLWLTLTMESEQMTLWSSLCALAALAARTLTKVSRQTACRTRVYTAAELAPHAVNTKADIRFSVGKADFLPDWVKNNLLQQARVLSST